MSKKAKNGYLLLDILLKKNLADSRLKAKALISASKVYVNGEVVNDVSAVFDSDDLDIQIFQKLFVSRAGYKLKKALDEFKIDLKGKVCIDAGSSTGGFTDCMLLYGASKVYAVDSAYNELAWKLRSDKRVVVKERTRISDLVIDEKVDFISVDLSLISIKKVLLDIKKHLKKDAQMVILIKPQYEIEKDKLPSGGVIKDSDTHFKILNDLIDYFKANGLIVLGKVVSPIKGALGNTEFLVHVENNILAK
ncbi:MAG: TlyA family RNA methyltransferase [Bdellovibrionota bacterium]